MLAELVDVVIGVDTHKHTHTAAVVTASTGAVVADLTVATDAGGYAELVPLADRHSGLRAWSVDGTGGYGAGLTRFLAERGELVIELDRHNRPARRNGAKSDPLDAVRAGREALSREHLAQLAQEIESLSYDAEAVAADAVHAFELDARFEELVALLDDINLADL